MKISEAQGQDWISAPGSAPAVPATPDLFAMLLAATVVASPARTSAMAAGGEAAPVPAPSSVEVPATDMAADEPRLAGRMLPPHEALPEQPAPPSDMIPTGSLRLRSAGNPPTGVPTALRSTARSEDLVPAPSADHPAMAAEVGNRAGARGEPSGGLHPDAAEDRAPASLHPRKANETPHGHPPAKPEPSGETLPAEALQVDLAPGLSVPGADTGAAALAAPAVAEGPASAAARAGGDLPGPSASTTPRSGPAIGPQTQGTALPQGGAQVRDDGSSAYRAAGRSPAAMPALVAAAGPAEVEAGQPLAEPPGPERPVGEARGTTQEGHHAAPRSERGAAPLEGLRPMSYATDASRPLPPQDPAPVRQSALDPAAGTPGPAEPSADRPNAAPRRSGPVAAAHVQETPVSAPARPGPGETGPAATAAGAPSPILPPDLPLADRATSLPETRDAGSAAGAGSAEPLSTFSPDWPAGIDDRLAAALDAGLSELEIVLSPESLGRLKIRVEMRDGAASVSFTTETPEAARLLAGQEGRLSDLLEKGGLSLARHEAGQGDTGARQDQPERGPRRAAFRSAPPAPDTDARAAGLVNLIA